MSEGVPHLGLIITLIIALFLGFLNFLNVLNNLAYILITAGFLILGFLLGIFLQGTDSPDESKSLGLKMLLIGIIMLILYFLW